MREPSIWELSEQIKAMDRAHREMFARIEAVLAGLDGKYLRADVYGARHDGLRSEVRAVADRVTEVDNRLGSEIADIRGSQRWQARAAVTGVIFPIVVTIVVAIVLAGGGLG